jgi:hypothetical protein
LGNNCTLGQNGTVLLGKSRKDILLVSVLASSLTSLCWMLIEVKIKKSAPSNED